MIERAGITKLRLYLANFIFITRYSNYRRRVYVIRLSVTPKEKFHCLPPRAVYECTCYRRRRWNLGKCRQNPGSRKITYKKAVGISHSGTERTVNHDGKCSSCNGGSEYRPPQYFTTQSTYSRTVFFLYQIPRSAIILKLPRLKAAAAMSAFYPTEWLSIVKPDSETISPLIAELWIALYCIRGKLFANGEFVFGKKLNTSEVNTWSFLKRLRNGSEF